MIDNKTNSPTDFSAAMPIVSGVVVPKMFALIHSVRDVYMVQYVMNAFLELTKNHSTFQKVTEGHFRFNPTLTLPLSFSCFHRRFG
jgi:hypothetical protein